jgi:hypothetical protein
MPAPRPSAHSHAHAFTGLNPLEREGLFVQGRRNLLKAGVAGLGGLSLPGLLGAREAAAKSGRSLPQRSVILLWMTGGPSHIDTWDPKPERPLENRGPFGTITSRIPGVRISEHLPLMAGMLDRFTVVRSFNARKSNHEPNTVFQTGNLEAEPRVNPRARMYPALGSFVAREIGAHRPGMPPYVAFKRSDSHIAYAGYLGRQYDPFIGNTASRLPIYTLLGENTGQMTEGDVFKLPTGLTPSRVHRRQSLRQTVDSVRSQVDDSDEVQALGRLEQKAVDLVLGDQAREAFDLNREPAAVRERYGKHLWHQQALLCRRLVERGVSFVTLDLSYHTASGTWDNHGDDVPPYGGIQSGLKPILPLFDHLITTLVSDLHERGLLDQTLVIGMGEFGRSPIMTPADGRNHWTNVAAGVFAGGGLRHGQVIGATDPDGGDIAERPVNPQDLAATIFKFMGVPLDTSYVDPTGRPVPAIQEGGEPLHELF